MATIFWDLSHIEKLSEIKAPLLTLHRYFILCWIYSVRIIQSSAFSAWRNFQETKTHQNILQEFLSEEKMPAEFFMKTCGKPISRYYWKLHNLTYLFVQIASSSKAWNELHFGKTRMRTSNMKNDTQKKTSENFVKVCYKSQKVFPNFSYLKKRRMKLVFVHYIS